MKNVNLTYEPKFKNPFTNEYDSVIHLVPAWTCPSDNPDNIYYCVVTCSPDYNGVYSYTYSPEDMMNHKYTIWLNNHRACLYLPLTDCTFVCQLNDVKDESLRKEIKKQQQKWWRGEVKNNPMKYTRSNGKKYKPDWMLK